jgi:hypothetical protein
MALTFALGWLLSVSSPGAYQAPKFSIEEIVPRQFGDCAVYENFIAELLAAASPEAQ